MSVRQRHKLVMTCALKLQARGLMPCAIAGVNWVPAGGLRPGKKTRHPPSAEGP